MRRNSTIANALAGAIDLGLAAGREEQSNRAESPPAKNRASHFLAVGALTPCAAAAAQGVKPPIVICMTISSRRT